MIWVILITAWTAGLLVPFGFGALFNYREYRERADGLWAVAFFVAAIALGTVAILLALDQ